MRKLNKYKSQIQSMKGPGADLHRVYSWDFDLQAQDYIDKLTDVGLLRFAEQIWSKASTKEEIMIAHLMLKGMISEFSERGEKEREIERYLQ